MEHFLSQGTKSPTNYLNSVKQEYQGTNVKNELFEYHQNMNYPEETKGEPNGFSATIWSVLVDRCRSLLQEQYEDTPISPQMITKILIKETNEFLLHFVNFFEECCNSISEEENYSENIIEVDGLFVNCLPEYLRTDVCITCDFRTIL